MPALRVQSLSVSLSPWTRTTGMGAYHTIQPFLSGKLVTDGSTAGGGGEFPISGARSDGETIEFLPPEPSSECVLPV